MMTKLIAGLLGYVVSSTVLAETPAFISNAVAAKGVRHSASEYRGKKPQWVIDAVHVVRPDYPSGSERRGTNASGFSGEDRSHDRHRQERNNRAIDWPR